MATGRIGVTPVLRTRWSDQPTAGTTSLSGLDDNSVALVYDAGYEAVYRNGVLLSRGNDYTATNGTSITLTDATLAGDIIEVFANDLVPLTDAISKGQYNAKGALLSASAASTPGVLTVGANGTVLTADSAETTGLKWATAGSGLTWTLLNTGGTSLTGSSVTISGITSENILVILANASSSSASSEVRMRLNGDSTAKYSYGGVFGVNPTTYIATASQGQASINNTYVPLGTMDDGASSVVSGGFTVNGGKSTGSKSFSTLAGGENYGANGQRTNCVTGIYAATAALSSVTVLSNAGSFDGGTIYVYGA